MREVEGIMFDERMKLLNSYLPREQESDQKSSLRNWDGCVYQTSEVCFKEWKKIDGWCTKQERQEQNKINDKWVNQSW